MKKISSITLIFALICNFCMSQSVYAADTGYCVGCARAGSANDMPTKKELDERLLHEKNNERMQREYNMEMQRKFDEQKEYERKQYENTRGIQREQRIKIYDQE